MLGQNKRQSGKKPRSNNLSDYGLFDVSVDDNFDENLSDGNDSDLEAELAAITSSGGQKPRRKPAPPPPMPAVDLDAMVADSLKEIDENVSSGDDDDPDLLDELNNIIDVTGGEQSESIPTEPEVILPTTQTNIPNLIKTRIEMYKLAEENAKLNNDTSRARRFARGLKTLTDQLKQANAGRTVNIDDIPPEVVVKPAAPSSETSQNTPTESSHTDQVLRPAPPPPRPQPIEPTPQPAVISTEDSKPETQSIPSTTTLNESKLNSLLERQREYKIAALTAKKSNNNEVALKYVRVIKMFDAVITACKDGQEVDLSDMPPSPNELDLSIFDKMPAASESMPDPVEPKKEDESKQTASVNAPSVVPVQPPEMPKTILEALNQRLEVYKNIEQTAKNENNGSKARRFGRIVKQYEDAIKLHKAGKPVAFDELPTPPNFPPIPFGDNQPPKHDAPKPTSSTDSNKNSDATPKSRPILQKQDSRVSGNHSNTSLMNKTIAIIQERQEEFKKAAIEAKKANELDEAKEYLKTYKGLESLLNVARGGMPVDLSTLPIPPSQRAQLEDTFIVIDKGDCTDDELSDISARLEEQLQKQLTMCKNTRNHNRALGDVAGTNRFENLALSVQKDLDIVRIARRNKQPIPKFRYEKKSFNILKCNTDLTENELEIEIVRGISYTVSNPKDIDTYVKVEFPYPQETPFKARTELVKDTDNPDYKEKFKVEIQPKNRQCQRVFKRHSVKFEIYSKGCSWSSLCCDPMSLCSFSGFFRSDTLIGTIAVKLQPLETTCEIHDSFNLMDGRKTLGGKLEVKIRIRNPILTKQMEHIEEKWLTIDG